MKYIDDLALERLRAAAEWPDLTGTGYRLLERVASGGMGVVYKAEDEALKRFVALKVLHIAVGDGESELRLAREACTLAQLEHPGIVPIHDTGALPDGRIFYAMKYVVGDRLDIYAKRVKSMSERLRVFLRICDTMAFAHARGYLHRDLKPENIMVGPFGEVLVMDWGLAKVCGANSDVAKGASLPETSTQQETPPSAFTKSREITRHGTVMGTPGYMSPEQERGDIDRIDPRSDIYSLGALLKFLVGEQIAAQEFSNPRVLRAIIAKAMASSPSDRYGNVSDLAKDVSLYLDGMPVSAYRESLWERAARFYRRHQVVILLLCAYLFMRTIFLLYPHPRT